MTQARYVWISLALLLIAAGAAAQTVDEIIAKNIETRGGLEALKAVQSVRITAKMTAMGNEVPVRVEWKRPSKLRSEFEMQGMKGVMAYDGEKGWMIMPFTGDPNPQPMPEDQLKMAKEQGDMIEGVLVDYKEKGHTIELLGTEDVEGTEAYKLKITRADGDIVYDYLDTEHCLEFKQESKRMVMGTETNFVTTIGDYKEVGDIVLAHSFESMSPDTGFGQSITLEQVEVNPEIDDSRFVMPEPETAPAAEEPKETPPAAEEPKEGGGR